MAAKDVYEITYFCIQSEVTSERVNKVLPQTRHKIVVLEMFKGT